MKWLQDTLEVALPQLSGAQRDEVASLVLNAIPKDVMAAVISDTVIATLAARHVVIIGEDFTPLTDKAITQLVTELGRNVAQSVLLLLEVGEEAPDERVAEVYRQ